ncbi:MAG: hypothetical protein K9J06_02635 [Flavobacteriales bacterium]|nr:hypothetical protein [Flavobacteriales bacterium]
MSSTVLSNTTSARPADIAKSAIHTMAGIRNIKKVIVIDDIVDYHPDVEPLFGWIRSLDEGGRLNVETQCAEIKINSEPYDVVVAEIRELWAEWDQVKKAKILRKVAEATKNEFDPSIQKDLSALSNLKNCLQDIDFIEISPSQWRSDKSILLERPPQDGRILCLIDKDLSRCSGFSPESGVTLLKEVVGEKHAHVIVGIISHQFEVATEVEHWQSFKNAYEIDFSDFIPLSKDRMNSYPLLAEGLKYTFLNQLAEQVKNQLAAVIQAASAKAQKEIKSLNVFNFRHIVFESSTGEGVSELNTLSRIYDIHLENEAPQILSHAKYQDLHVLVALTRKLCNVPVGRDEISPSTVVMNNLRHIELYEAGSTLNPSYSPIQTGDIFEISGKWYILMAQPCDLMVRASGEREVNHSAADLIGPLVAVGKEASLNEFRKSKEGKGYLPYIANDSDKGRLVEFDDVVYVNVQVLDLAVFNEKGVCKIDLTKGPLVCPTRLHSPWVARYGKVQEFYSVLEKRIIGSLKQFDSFTSSRRKYVGIKSLVLQGLFPSLSIPQIINTAKIYSNGKFDFGIRRVLRLREPEASSLLRAYLSYKAREAKDHDFAKVK